MYRDPGSNESNEWFAFRVRPRHEKQVSLALREKGFTEFLPLYKSKRQWADRTKVVEMPLFPGYIFCSTVRSSIVPVLMTSGVIDVVRAGTNPLPADKAEIEALQQTVSVDVPLALLNQVDENAFSWQIPGHREELVTALIRSLPGVIH